MSKTYETIINDFSGGIALDLRTNEKNKFALTKHFDANTFPHKLVPYYQTDAVTSNVLAANGKDLKIVKFLYAPYTAGSYRLYGFGTSDYTLGGGNDSPAVFIYDIDAAVPDTTLWNVPVKNSGTTTGRNTEVFFYYKNFIYMWSGGTVLCAFDTTGTNNFNNAYQSISYTTLAAPVYHPSDDVAYFFSDNNVHTLNNVTWSTNALILPTNVNIVSACAYGDYIAIATVTKGSLDYHSVVYLWDRNSPLSGVTQRIDFGEGSIVHLANLNGKLIAVMNFYLDNFYGLNNAKIFVKEASGNFAVLLNELIADTVTTVNLALPRTRQVRDNKLYFPAKATLNSDSRLGIWVVDENGKLNIDFLETSATSYEGIFGTGNMWFVAHSSDGSVSRTDSLGAYSASNAATYESLIFNLGDSSQTKKLKNIIVTTEPMPTAGQIVLKYRRNWTDKNGTVYAETAWTTVFTSTTDNVTQHEAINIESSGANLPSFCEIQFQILSTGGAVITGFSFNVETVNDGKLS